VCPDAEMVINELRDTVTCDRQDGARELADIRGLPSATITLIWPVPRTVGEDDETPWLRRGSFRRSGRTGSGGLLDGAPPRNPFVVDGEAVSLALRARSCRQAARAPAIQEIAGSVLSAAACRESSMLRSGPSVSPVIVDRGSTKTMGRRILQGISQAPVRAGSGSLRQPTAQTPRHASSYLAQGV
jgi:hypothetical protein